MKNATCFLFFVIHLLCIFVPATHGIFNLVVKKFELCDPDFNYTNTLYATVRTVNGQQYLDGNATLRVAADDEMQSTFTVQMLVGKSYVPIIKMEDKHTCSFMHRYMGEFICAIERTAQLVPGLCPIPPGRYHVHNHPLNFNMVSLQSFPFGHLRMTEIATDKNQKLILCFRVDVENLA